MIYLLMATGSLIVLAWLLGPRTPTEGGPDEIHGALTLLWWLNRGYCVALHGLVCLNEAKLPRRGPAILVSNHTSGVDNLILQAGCHRVLGFMIAQEFHDAWLVRPFSRLLGCIPVKRDGRDLSATRSAIRSLENGRVLPIFPEGRITPKSGREFGPGKPGAAFLALRTDAPVIPAYLRGTPEKNAVWKALITPSKARVIFGPPIDLADLRAAHDEPGGEKARLEEATRRIMDAIKSLRPVSLDLEATL